MIITDRHAFKQTPKHTLTHTQTNVSNGKFPIWETSKSVISSKTPLRKFYRRMLFLPHMYNRKIDKNILYKKVFYKMQSQQNNIRKQLDNCDNLGNFLNNFELRYLIFFIYIFKCSI